MNKHHLAASLLVASTVALGVPATAAATPSAAAGDTCTLYLQTTKAVNLQHDVAGEDRVRARLGNTITTERTYFLGQRRNTGLDGTETFSHVATAKLQVEVLNGAWLTIDTEQVHCEDATRELVLRNGDANYKVRAIVRVVP